MSVRNERKVGQYWATIVGVKCPYCNTINYINLGDLNDLTVPDVEAIICYKCLEKFWTSSLARDEHAINAEDCTPEDLGLNPGDDLILMAYEDKGHTIEWKDS